VISPGIAFEYEAVLKRDHSHPHITASDIDDFICSRVRLVQPVSSAEIAKSYCPVVVMIDGVPSNTVTMAVSRH
jgi:hypothetical protein